MILQHLINTIYSHTNLFRFSCTYFRDINHLSKQEMKYHMFVRLQNIVILDNANFQKFVKLARFKII